MGKICKDNFLFFFSNSVVLDIICYIAIFLCIIFLILLQYKHFFNSNRLKRLKIFLIFTTSICFLIFFVGNFWILLHRDNFYGCMNSFDKVHSDTKNIIIGDSRMEFIVDDKKIQVPYNMIFIAKSGKTLEWFRDYAIPEFNDNVKDKNFKYNVVINMGVNDLNYGLDSENRADEYYDIYDGLAKKYPQIDFYIMSINPIRYKLLEKSEPGNVRTNEKIDDFNKTIVKNIKNSEKNNIHYCDSYHDLKFDTDDGLHYTRETNKKIIKYITDDCIEY